MSDQVDVVIDLRDEVARLTQNVVSLGIITARLREENVEDFDRATVAETSIVKLMVDLAEMESNVRKNFRPATCQKFQPQGELCCACGSDESEHVL